MAALYPFISISVVCNASDFMYEPAFRYVSGGFKARWSIRQYYRKPRAFLLNERTLVCAPELKREIENTFARAPEPGKAMVL